MMYGIGTDNNDPGSIQLQEIDCTILDYFNDGRVTQGYLVDLTGYRRHNIREWLSVLTTIGYINRLHKPTALYELVDDPREDPPNEVSLETEAEPETGEAEET